MTNELTTPCHAPRAADAGRCSCRSRWWSCWPSPGAAFWYFAAAKAETTLTEWREREAKAGRIYSCATQSIGGYPFRIEVRCIDPTTELRGSQPPVPLKAKDLLAAVQVYDPTLVISEFTGPMTIAAPGQPPSFVANWTLAQSSVRGTPAFAAARLDRGRSADGRSRERRRPHHRVQGHPHRAARPHRGARPPPIR